MVFKEIKTELNIWTPENVGDSIEGAVKTITAGTYGANFNLIVGADKDGNDIIKTLPSHKTLLNILTENEIKVGDLIKVTYTGEETSANKQKYRTYKVFVDRE